MKHAKADPFYHEIRQAFQEPGCPVCRVLAGSADSYLDGVLWEMVTDRIVRAEINEARGYCQQHSWLLDRLGGALGTAILTRGIVKTLLDTLESHPVEEIPGSLFSTLRGSLGQRQSPRAAGNLLRALEAERPCPLCTYLDDVGRHVVGTLVAHLHEEDELIAAYRDSDGLCQVHFRQALAQAHSAAVAQTLVGAQNSVWQRLYEELGEFIRKKDYHSKGEEYGPERDSWLRALAALAGPPPQSRSRM
jgi:hypothetical protein